MRAALLLFCASLFLTAAAPPTRPLSAAKVAAGSYVADPDHTQIRFGVSHFSISSYFGIIGGATGTLSIDPAKIADAKVDMTIPIVGIMTTSSKLTDELKSSDWFDAGTFPDATFKSTKIIPAGPEDAAVQGILTLHGVSKPVLLHAKYFGGATNPITGKPNIGFTATGAIKRSDFGVSKMVPMISDVVALTISAAFEKVE